MIVVVVGARPNFMKMAPVVSRLQERNLPLLFVHTGQHYDENMSRVFFDELGMPEPDIHLDVGSDSHARQTAQVMVGVEDILSSNEASLLLVAGDVNSTLASALAASKLGVSIAHLEAGLRSFDRSMPEEVNRVVTDHLSELLFTTEESANKNLRAEGVDQAKVFFVGNCMIDSLMRFRERAIQAEPWNDFGLERGRYGVVTLHRPSNVGETRALMPLMQALQDVSREVPLLFPVHPRTRAALQDAGFNPGPALSLVEPLPYIRFLGLLASAGFVLTDSGGIQEESTVLGVPCLTYRQNTERPATVEMGTNRLLGTNPDAIPQAIEDALSSSPQREGCPVPDLWDGLASQRVADEIEAWLAATRSSV